MTEIPAKTFGETIRELRVARSLSQRRLAEKAGVSLTHLGLLEGDKAFPHKPDVTRTLAEALGVEAERLFSLPSPAEADPLAYIRANLAD